MNKKASRNGLKIRTGIFFLAVLFFSIIGFVFFNQFQEKERKLESTYTAEATIRKVETQISRYLENSDLFKNIISSGYSISDEQFTDLARFMKKNKNVIEAYELAPDGVVQQVYPYEGNQEAIGMNMLELPERKTEALLAKETKEYTIAGPYELKQGGIGALIFDPIYQEIEGRKEFWGFSILVINWEKFLEELQIDKLGDARYRYDVWKRNADGDRITIMNDGHGKVKHALTVPCSVPNDTWYFEIVPEGGWIPFRTKIMEYFLSVLIAAFLAVGYWQTGMRKRREVAYAERLEESAKEAQAANEAKTRFLFNMSHDIRTPMNAIVGYSNLLEESLDQKEVALDYIKKIKASNTMLLSLINYILEMARIESGKMVLKEEHGDLKKFMEMLKAVSEPQIRQKELHVMWNLDVEHTDIICDTTKLREIVMNIVNNAIKYTPQNGSISMTVKELEAEKEGYASYCFEVEDNGIGMKEEYIPHIFEEFSREHTTTESKVAGVGLGLPIVKALVDMMHGTIHVDSQQNKGTRFSVYLSFPIADSTEESDNKSKEEQENMDFTGREVLLVEDNELNAEIAKEILTRQGITVDLAENGQECLELLEKKQESSYDAILMDIQMPVMNGYEAAKEIRKSGKVYANVPIIAMTANAFEEDREQAIDAGMNGHIAKPVDVSKLMKVLNKVFLGLLLVFGMMLPAAFSVDASQDETIRTAFFDGAYIEENENGEKTGYGYEFQQAVASYTGWKYDYVTCDWTNCYSMLESGELDLLGGISYTDERAQTMLFSDLPMGEERYYLYTNLTHTDISLSDLTSLNGKKIGVLEQSIPEKLLNEWENKHNLHMQHVGIISAEDILDKMASHEIDCFISNENPVWGESEITAFTLIGSSDIYFVMNKERTDLKIKLDNAMRKIEHDKPFYKEDLYKEYFSAESYEVLSDEEQSWVEQHGVIRAGYYKDDSGVSMIDPETGKLIGAINDYVKRAANCLGNQTLQFELVGFDTQTEEYQALEDGKIDMIFHATQNPYQAEQNDLILSNEVFESSMAVMTTSDHFDEHENNVVAVTKDAIWYKWYISDNYPQWEICEYDSREDMVNAVQNGEADCFVIRARQSIKEYENSKINSVFLTQSSPSCFAVKRENTILLGILNKTLDNVQTSQMSGAVAAYDNAIRKITFSDFMRDNWYVVTDLLAGIFLVILFVIIRSNKKTQKALIAAEKANEAKSNFLFNMSHDIRTPMNALLGYNELMKKELTDPKLLDYQEKIAQAGKLLLSIINNVLDMARIESGKVELDENYVNITETVGRVDGVFEEEAKKKDIHFFHEVNLEHAHIMCDIAKVHEILVNLISNAVKYTPEGGTITIRTTELPSEKEGFVCIKIEVADTGIGMSKEFLPSLFVPFTRERNTTTGKVAGTGLGMPIVKKYVDMMGGTIEVESELGKGSKFTVILHHRMADKIYYEQKAEQHSEVEIRERIRGRHILLAEDNDLNAEIAMTMMEEKGLIVERVEDGMQCVAKIEQKQAGSYDMILMDIQMPNMDGYTATQAIRQMSDKQKANIPIVAMTANAFEEDRQKAFAVGMNEHIAKPVDVAKVEQVLLALL